MQGCLDPYEIPNIIIFQIPLKHFLLMQARPTKKHFLRFTQGWICPWLTTMTSLGIIWRLMSAKCKLSSFYADLWAGLRFLVHFRFGGTLEGEWCNYVPDIFFFSVTLFFGTFLLATWLKQFKMSRYFPNFVSRVPKNQVNIDNLSSLGTFLGERVD